MEKIPDATRFNMIRGTEKRQVNWGIDDLVKAISKELEIRECHGSLLKHVGQEKGTRPRREDTDTTTASSLFVSGGKVFRGKCVYCLKEHAPEDCSEVKDVSERKGILIRQARCLVCLNAKHRAFECRSKLFTSVVGGGTMCPFVLHVFQGLKNRKRSNHASRKLSMRLILQRLMLLHLHGWEAQDLGTVWPCKLPWQR